MQAQGHTGSALDVRIELALTKDLVRQLERRDDQRQAAFIKLRKALEHERRKQRFEPPQPPPTESAKLLLEVQSLAKQLDKLSRQWIQKDQDLRAERRTSNSLRRQLQELHARTA